MNTQQAKAVAGAGSANLTNKQKANIVQAARMAWLRNGRPGYADQPDMPKCFRMSQTEAFDVWRHDEQKRAVGAASLTSAVQRDYAPVMAHFARLAGDHKSADYWTLREAGNPARQARAALENAIRRTSDRLGDSRSYAMRIAKCRFQRETFDDLAENQLWTLVFDLRRAAAKKGKTQC